MELTREKIINLLQTEDEQEIQELFSQARAVREKQFGRKMFLYGFVYFTTWCRNDCAFCYYRKSNKIDRYRKSPEEVIRLSKELADSGVHLIDLTMGEDLAFHKESFQTVLSIIGQIKDQTGLPVMISPGVISDSLIRDFAAAGTDWVRWWHFPVIWRESAA